jgi:opacity protein-like surface antigen
MFHRASIRRYALLGLLALAFAIVPARSAAAQGFISPTFGYNFGGDTGCLAATDCENKNWNWGLSGGALGSIVGFEAEVMHEAQFTGETSTDPADVTTLMANFMLAPRITIVQPYGLAGLGMIRTHVDGAVSGSSESDNQVGWTVGGGLMVFVQKHVALKGDIRYYHSLEALDLLGIDLARDENKVDFGRAGFGVVFAF